MKLTSKRLISILLVLAFAMAMLPMSVIAADSKILYLVPNSQWLLSNARFAAYLANEDWSEFIWVDAIDSDGDGVYEIALPADGIEYAYAILCRMNPSSSTNDWNNKWTQTDDLTIPTDGRNCYIMDSGSWDGNGSWTTFEPAIEKAPMEISKVIAVGDGSGNFVYGVGWDPADDINIARESEETPGVYSITYMGIDAGTYEFKFSANGSWDYSWGTGGLMESGVVYDAEFKGYNSSFVVNSNNATVTLTIDLSEIDPDGNGATMSVEIEEREQSYAPDSFELGTNELIIAGGDTSVVGSTFTAEKDGVLSITPSMMNVFDAYTGEWSSVPASNIPMQFGRQYGLIVNGQQVWLPFEMAVSAGDVVEIGVQSSMGNAAEVVLDLAISDPVIPGAADIKWQLNADASADDASVDLRLISWADSLDYSSVTFNVTINGVTAPLNCTTVYTAINVAGGVLDNPTIFNENAAYFVTYTIENLPASYYNSEIEVYMVWTDLDGVVTDSAVRTIVVAEDWA